MTESQDRAPPPAVQRRLELFRHRRAAMAATRAEFELRRHHGLKSRHEAKLAHLATRTQKEEPQQEAPHNDAA